MTCKLLLVAYRCSPTTRAIRAGVGFTPFTATPSRTRAWRRARRGPATRTLRRATAQDLERNFSLFWNGINEPESSAAYFGAEITLPPWKTGLLETGTPSAWKPPVGSAPLAHGDAVEAAYARAVATARTDNDADVVAQALLELGDFKALTGHPTAAAFHWSACVDQITGCYRAVTTAGASAVPGDPEACLRRYGVWGGLRGARAGVPPPAPDSKA